MSKPDDIKTLRVGLVVTLVQAVLLFLIGLVVGTLSQEVTPPRIFAIVSAIVLVNRLVASYDLKREIAAGRSQIANEVDTQRQQLAHVSAQLDRLGTILDLTDESGVREVVAIGRSYVSITNPRLQEVKERIARQTAADLGRLHHEQKTPVLDEPDFYKWLFHEFAAAGQHTVIRIVSMDEDLEWTDTHEERAFWRYNVEAAQRGASITRIFVFAEGRLEQLRSNPAIYGHRRGSETGIVGKVVDRARLERQSPQALAEARQGFILIDDTQAIVDVFSADGQARGYATFNPSEIKNLHQLFDKFDAVARPLVFDQGELTSGPTDAPALLPPGSDYPPVS